MSDEITITRKYVIYPIASDMKEWERKVIKYVSEAECPSARHGNAGRAGSHP